MKNNHKFIIMLILFVTVSFLSGCMNMPTPPSQITGSYTSGLKYESFDCPTLSAELNSLARRQNQLTSAQDQRIKTSQTQAFWYGYGQGDGVEASELANVKGEKEAVRKAIEKKKCENGISILKRLDQEEAAREEKEAIEKLVKEEYKACLNSFGSASCKEDQIRKKISASYESSPDHQDQSQESAQITPESNENISKETLRKAKICQSKGGLWINDQCILSID